MEPCPDGIASAVLPLTLRLVPGAPRPRMEVTAKRDTGFARPDVARQAVGSATAAAEAAREADALEQARRPKAAEQKGAAAAHGSARAEADRAAGGS